MPLSNVAIAYAAIATSESSKNRLRGLVVAKAEVAEGISLLQPCSDEALVAILQALEGKHILLVRVCCILFVMC